MRILIISVFFFFFNDTATTEIYTLSLHDALPICSSASVASSLRSVQQPSRSAKVSNPKEALAARSDQEFQNQAVAHRGGVDRKSTRLNSSHGYISYAVFCLKKKKQPHSVYTIRAR